MSFQTRLQKVMERGNLRVADVARWFGRRHSTIRGWVVDGREPAGTATDVRGLFWELNKLEEVIQLARKQKLTSFEVRASTASIGVQLAKRRGSA